MSRKRPPVDPVGKSILYHHDNKNVRSGMRFRITCVPPNDTAIATVVVTLEKVALSLPRDPAESQLKFILDTTCHENEWLLDRIDQQYSFVPGASKNSDERRVWLFAAYRTYLVPLRSSCILATDDCLRYTATAHHHLKGNVGTVIDIELLPS